jgi:hypothetical protein
MTTNISGYTVSTTNGARSLGNTLWHHIYRESQPGPWTHKRMGVSPGSHLALQTLQILGIPRHMYSQCQQNQCSDSVWCVCTSVFDCLIACVVCVHLRPCTGRLIGIIVYYFMTRKDCTNAEEILTKFSNSRAFALHLYSTLPYSTVLYSTSTVLYCTLQYSTVLYSTSTVPLPYLYSTLPYLYRTLQYSTVPLQYSTVIIQNTAFNVANHTHVLLSNH